MAIIRTKVVNNLPETAHLEANTQYFTPTSSGKFEHFVTDNNKNLRQLEIDVNENLLRQSSVFMSLFRVLTTGYVTVRLWDATPVIYGLRNSASGSEVWGVHSESISLNSELLLKDLRNKTITVSVDVYANLKSDVGLGVVESDVTYQTIEAKTWTRISKTYSGTKLCGIWAKLASDVTVSGVHNHLTNYVHFKNWKVEEGHELTSWLPCPNDYMDNASHYVKTYRLSNSGAFRNDTLIETQFQNGKTIGLANRNTTLTISYTVYTFKCRYLFLYDNSTFTISGITASNVVSNSDTGDPLSFSGNKGDFIDLEFYQDEVNQMRVSVFQTKYRNELNFALPVTSNLVLNATHAGRILQFNNTTNITVDITNLPAGATLSGVKNSGAGNITFIGTTAPLSDSLLNNTINSSFSLIKNASGTSNLLISNK